MVNTCSMEYLPRMGVGVLGQEDTPCVSGTCADLHGLSS